MPPAPTEPWSDPPASWVPIRAVWTPGGAAVQWLDFGAENFTAPFFSQSVAARLGRAPEAGRHGTGLDALVRAAERGASLAPAGFVFHMSRCGSTLVSRKLAAMPGNLVLAEPDPVNDVLGPSWQPAGEMRRQQALTPLLAALGRPRTAGQSRYFVKFSSWNAALLSTILAGRESVPKLFVYRDPIEVMVSLLHEPPGWLGARKDIAYACRLSGANPGQLAAMDGDEYAACVLARMLTRTAERFDPTWLLVDYRELARATVSSIPKHFGLTLGEEDIAAMRALDGVHVKDASGTRPFVDDSAAKRGAATERVRHLVARWLAEPYARLEALRAAQPAAN